MPAGSLWGGARSLTEALSQGPTWAAHLTSCGNILGCSQKAWSSGLILRTADSEGTRAVTRLSAGSVMPAICAHTQCAEGQEDEGSRHLEVICPHL